MPNVPQLEEVQPRGVHALRTLLHEKKRTLLHERRQTRNATYCTTPQLPAVSRISRSIEIENALVAPKGWGMGVTQSSYGLSFCDRKDV